MFNWFDGFGGGGGGRGRVIVLFCFVVLGYKNVAWRVLLFGI